MSALIISLPLAAASPASLYAYTGSAGEPVRNASASLLPLAGRGAEVVAVVPMQALSWFTVDLPAGKALKGEALRNALIGLLEDRLLSEPEPLHMALQPGWQPGQRAVVAVCHKAWLHNHLLNLEAAGKTVTRIVPALSPARTAEDAQLFAIISAFDAAYGAYNTYQAGMERFWTLQYIGQQGITELEATLFKEAAGGQWLVRADELPLVLTVLGAQGLERGAKVRVKLGHIDAIALDVHGTVLERLESPAAAPVDENAQDEFEDDSAGPLTIAVDLSEPPLEPAA